MGDVLHFTAHYAGARLAFQEAASAVNAFNAPQPIWLCRLHRKIGSSLLPQHQYEPALAQFEGARTALGEQPLSDAAPWWREWIALQQERKYTFYWLNRWQDIIDIMEESRPVLEKLGTPAQRAFFSDPSPYFRRDRFVVSDEVMDLAREWQAANLALNDPALIPATHFLMGFVFLWHDDLQEAEAEMRAALALSLQTGDVSLRARCLTYLTILCRKQKRVADVQTLVEQSQETAEEAEMPEYVATAHANRAWLAWIDDAEAQLASEGQQALAIWSTLPVGHASCAFQWTALFPLLALAAQNHEFEAAAAYSTALLHPSQQKQPEPLASALQTVLIMRKQAPAESIAAQLKEIIYLARQFDLL